MRGLLIVLLLAASLAACAEAIASPDSGEVRVPLDAYTTLLEQLRSDPRPAPAAYAIGVSGVEVRVKDRDQRITAEIDVELRIETFEDEWTLVPILPSGTALAQARVNGRPVQLVQGPSGLAWSTRAAGTAIMSLRYGVDARRSETGFVLPIPVPRAAATSLRLQFPATDVDLAVVPSADLVSEQRDGSTLLRASVPSTTSVLVSWRAPSARAFAMSRASYWGKLSGDALLWRAEYDVELFEGERVELPLMPSSVTLGELRVDGKPAVVLEADGRFQTIVRGRGLHKVQVSFQVPIVEQDGPPFAKLLVPEVPVSHFELLLPGRKELQVSPRANIVTSEQANGTLAKVFVPMSESVVFSWIDAIPEDLRAQVRANATLYHALHADEGVLHGRALVVYEVSRGETSQLELRLPHRAQVNRIAAPSGGVSDWAETLQAGDEFKTISVFLDRAVKGELMLDISYEYLLGGGLAPGDPIDVPLLSAVDVHRQRGMVALLAGPELTLRPVEEQRLSRVGENQLPAFMREQIDMTIAHTYKYTESMPALRVDAVAPERKQGKFNAQVDTLISIGEVTMKGSATVEINVKSGSIMALSLRVPADVNVLGVTAPSLRSHEVEVGENGQTIQLAFTQEMEGQFRLELNYERIMVDGALQNPVPTIGVAKAEVEHGRIAIEALSAVEVQPAVVEQLSPLDLNELPQQLVLKTTNPILLAYKYVQAERPFQLALTITRHEEIDVQVAAIEAAQYSTLFTRDGLAVTTASLRVRNSRRQFLRLELPPDSEIWSVFSDGKAEKPAHADDGPGGSVLIKMINSASGFPVEIVYATKVGSMGFLGDLRMRLPRPDMVVTHTRWDVYLPPGPRYRAPQSSLDVVVNGKPADADLMRAGALSKVAMRGGRAIGEPLRISVPTRGVHFAFEKLYANQSPRDAQFSIRYASAEGNRLGLALSALGVLLVWSAIVAIAGRRAEISRKAMLSSLLLGTALLIAAIGYLGTDPTTVAGFALVLAFLIGAWIGVVRLQSWRVSRA